MTRGTCHALLHTMLGGILTAATFLAFSDARPDPATLSAVATSPRSRRRVAAASALVVGLTARSRLPMVSRLD